MSYLTNVGPDGGSRYNKSGYGARGYWVFRRGTAVVTRWGAITPFLRKGYDVRWVYWRENTVRCRSITNARAEMKEIIRKLTRPSSGYSVLRRGLRIH